jgi:hypothetical protein
MTSTPLTAVVNPFNQNGPPRFGIRWTSGKLLCGNVNVERRAVVPQYTIGLNPRADACVETSSKKRLR